TSLSFASFWSGQLIVPASLSPSFVIVSVDIRFWSPIEYSHFHVPTGSTLSAAPARPQNPSTNAAERIVFMFASKKLRAGRRPTRTASSRCCDSRDAATTGQQGAAKCLLPGRTKRISCRGRLQDLHAARNQDGGP